ncbi:hypothetical protein LCGC14_0893230 [marine sediment metagenome]|uniref:Uncharacterized protein n=1 Tax=marine sediment metagenome TaxID=412755 RepID=A0A0F9NYL7_9ZZZZ
MCINDWRAGRLIRTQTRQVDISGGAATVTANPNRVGLIIGWGRAASTIQGASIAVDGNIVGGVNGVANQYFVTLADHGDLPTKEHIITNVNGSTTIGIVEMFMPEEYLAAGLNEFISHYAVHHGAIGR